MALTDQAACPCILGRAGIERVGKSCSKGGRSPVLDILIELEMCHNYLVEEIKLSD